MHNSRTKILYRDLQEVRELWNEWDPIGVCAPENEIEDEYDYYLEETLQMPKQELTIAEIENYLIFVIKDQMGFDDYSINKSNPNVFANKLHDWYENLKKRRSNLRLVM
ncbi:hypothetical protein [Nitrosomonas supralitoralis]|uniref:DUF1871 family protein n=1 Tax=Nitrosomonas supralitoralis TaxID=2116706 RepID=A0A2P7NVX9_9PROT|nr:hypothetical protein [Nitrosomonas supralitoralis]PSJ17626.1 hypothetical protein C7H79_06900 [Nitrosomonas supralitoralis]